MIEDELPPKNDDNENGVSNDDDDDDNDEVEVEIEIETKPCRAQAEMITTRRRVVTVV